MRISYNWLRQLLPRLNASAREVAETLTQVGLELEAQIEIGTGLEPLRIAEVLRTAPHPTRDRLQLVTVRGATSAESAGAGEQTVVCGAGNVPAPGGLVVLAPLGSYLPAVDLKLEPRKLGGVVSEGMLCSETELGLASDSEGILTFEAGRFQAGTPLLQALPEVRDTVFEIGVTPNRPDALGHRGVARDLAAALGIPFEPPEPRPPARVDERACSELITVENRAPDRCPRYGAAVVTGVQVQPSPHWLRWRLHALGIRPISNVVDITNLVLFEYGNPMHAFDLAHVAERRIIVRPAAPGERMTTLDGTEHQLQPDDLVIADAEKPSALAGIMGGADSEIGASTRDVLLECAYFEPRGIRRTARRLAIQSDSSYRFERGVGYAHLEQVLQRACELLVELCSGRVAAGQVFADGPLPAPIEVTLRAQRMQQLLGVELDWEQSLQTLRCLGFESVQADATAARFTVPSFRPDVTLEADLIEEVARIAGLERIPSELPRIQPQAPTGAGAFERQARQLATSLGLSEAVTYSFVSEKQLQQVHAPTPTVKLQNPLTEERGVLATSLLPGMLEVVQRARRRGENNLRLFTLASRFLSPIQALPVGEAKHARPRDAADVGQLPEERPSLGVVLAGERPAYLSRSEPVDVFDAKGVASELVERLTRRHVEVQLAQSTGIELPHLHPRGAALLLVDGVRVGEFGPIHPDVDDALDLGGSVQWVQLDLAALQDLGRQVAKYQPIPKLPAVTRDIALEAPEQLPAGQLLETIRQSAGPLCESVELFDLFKGQGMSAGRRSLAFRLVYRDPKATSDAEGAKTLTDKQVDKHHQKVIQAVEQLGVSLRA